MLVVLLAEWAGGEDEGAAVGRPEGGGQACWNLCLDGHVPTSDQGRQLHLQQHQQAQGSRPTLEAKSACKEQGVCAAVSS